MSSHQQYHVPSVQTHLVESRQIGETFQIQVMQPVMTRGANERFPVLYITDANLLFDVAKGLAQALQIAGQVHRFILVGIGYPGDNPLTGAVLRCRDFTSEWRPDYPGVPLQIPIEGVPGFAEGQKRWQGASDFLDFIRDDLVPLIDGAYPTIAGERTYCGHSMGGGFGFHALFSRPDLFNRHLLVSPCVVYGEDDHGLREAADYIASGKRLDAKLFMAVGGEEEFEARYAPMRFVSGFHRMAALLREKGPAGLDLTAKVYPGETHSSVVPFAFSHGVQALYGAPEQPPLILVKETE